MIRSPEGPEMTRIGTPLSPTATRVLLCGCGELGKEVVIELQRLGVEVIAVDQLVPTRRPCKWRIAAT